ncbi:MAG: CvpA family protein [Eubacteriaceae bacterium]
MSWIDILMIVVFIFFIVVGLKRGLVLTLTSLISFIASLVVANMFYKGLSEYIIKNTQMDEKICSFLSSTLQGDKSTEVSSIIGSSEVTNLPQGAQGYIEQFINNTVIDLSSNISSSIAYIIVHIVSFVLIFLAVKILLSIIAHMFDMLSKLPVINFINKTGGGIIGLLEGAIINVIIISIIYSIALFGDIEVLVNSINNSVIAPYFYIAYIFY